MTAVYTYRYDESYHPAMPVVELRLIAPESGQSSQSVHALVDSGADGSMMPVEVLDEIRALSVGTAVMRGLWGDRRRVNTYLVTLEIGGHLIRGVRVAGVATAMAAIVGRDVLNALTLTLNGPANMVELAAERP